MLGAPRVANARSHPQTGAGLGFWEAAASIHGEGPDPVSTQVLAFTIHL